MEATSLTISLENVRLYGRHGVFLQEREVGAEFEVSIDVTMQASDGCITDDINGTVSYADIFEVLKEEFEIPSALIENVASRILDALRKRLSHATAITVKIRKISPPIPSFQGSAAVTLSWR